MLLEQSFLADDRVNLTRSSARMQALENARRRFYFDVSALSSDIDARRSSQNHPNIRSTDQAPTMHLCKEGLCIVIAYIAIIQSLNRHLQFVRQQLVGDRSPGLAVDDGWLSRFRRIKSEQLAARFACNGKINGRH